MIDIAPRPVPVPYETVPSYETGQMSIFDRSNEDKPSSSIPPKFIGNSADSLMLSILDASGTFSKIRGLAVPQLWHGTARVLLVQATFWTLTSNP